MPVAKPIGRILVIDDYLDVTADVTAVLSQRGYQVDCASDSLNAMALLRLPPLPEIVLLDLVMPQFDGIRFLGQMRRRPEMLRVPVIVMTGNEMTATEFQDLKASALLQKPFSARELLATVDLHLGARLS